MMLELRWINLAVPGAAQMMRQQQLVVYVIFGATLVIL
jgi:hypothetical protein